MRVAIIQSCYIPWKGFFDLIGRCDEYIVFDSAQYVKRHWHNRNRIKTSRGTEWLTVPVVTKGRFHQAINTVEVEKAWAEKHWRAIELSYRHAPFFESFAPTVKRWYELANAETLLTDVNRIFLQGISDVLRLKTRISIDGYYAGRGVKTERLLTITQAAGADIYLSGPSARSYLDKEMFAAAGIEVEWMNYDHYPRYSQLHGDFVHEVSILDPLFNLGPNVADCFTSATQA